MPSTFADYARAAGAWLKSKPLHTVAPLALFFAIPGIAGIAAIPHHHAGAASADARHGAACCTGTGAGVLLLDEIEKAHPAALKVLMNLLDETRITEQSTGRTYSARGFLIVMTSNAAVAEIAKVAAIESDPVMRETKVKNALRDDGLLPEILARIDTVFPFARLSNRDAARVVERFLLQFAHDGGSTLESCDPALRLDLVTRANKTRDYGVREVVRSIESAVVDGLIGVRDDGYTRAVIRVVEGHVSV